MGKEGRQTMVDAPAGLEAGRREEIGRLFSETLGGSVSCFLLLLYRDGTSDGTRRVAFHRTR